MKPSKGEEKELCENMWYCVTVISMAERPIQLKEKIENASVSVYECLEWKDVYNNVPDIHSTEIIDQPKTLTHTNITQIHPAHVCLHLSSFFDNTYNIHCV